MVDNYKYYVENKKYSLFLDTQKESDFSIYLEVIKKYISQKDKFLDVGCGTGIVVNNLAEKGINAYGCEISQSSVNIAKNKKGKFFHYDGKKINYADKFFDAVGSFNVLEHVADPLSFLNESLRLVDKNGVLIVCTPNFLSITNSFHYRTAGFSRKFVNLLIILKKMFFVFILNKFEFQQFPPLVREDFHPDDDAINLTNPIDLIGWGNFKKLEILTVQGSIMEAKGIKKLLSKLPVIKFFMGSILIVYKKT